LAKQKKDKPQIVVFACHWGGLPLLKAARLDSSASIRAVRLMCGGRLSVGIILRAFELGADGVAVLACEEGECHYGFGARRSAEEFELARKMAYLLGIEEERLGNLSVHPGDVEKTTEDMVRFIEGVKKLARSPITVEEDQGWQPSERQ
jgi:coenzyme F420-reducing hydrogenase delta subunit